MKISFIIPSVNQFAMVFKCVDSLVKYNGEQEIIVVDDGSQPLVKEQLKAECAKRKIKCFFNERNSGFSTTVNRGMKEATGDVFVLTNNDIIFTQSVVKQIEESFALHPKIGVVGSLLFYPHGTIQHGGIQMIGNDFVHRGWHRRIEHADEVTRPEYIFATTGALFAIRAEMLKEIGGFNESFFLAFEDTEYCLRTWSSGWRVFYNPKIQAIHAEGATRGRTTIEKQTKYRVWFIKELETLNKFKIELKKHDLPKIFADVAKLNAERVSVSVMNKADIKAECMVFHAPEQTNKKKRFLVRRTGAVGDVLLVTGVVKELKKVYPDSEITVCTAYPDVLQNNPYIADVVTRADGSTYDKFIDLDLSYEMNPNAPIWETYADKALGRHDFDLRPEMFSGQVDKITMAAEIGDIVDFEKDKIAVIHASTSWPSRTWSVQSWNEVALNLSASGYKVLVVGTGGNRDAKLDAATNILNVHNRLTLMQIRELCKVAAVFIGVDSGVLHVAQTTEVPIVGLFTVANPEYRVFHRKAMTVALVPKAPCRFCLHEQKAPVTFVACKFGTNHCVNEITAVDVVSAVESIAR